MLNKLNQFKLCDTLIRNKSTPDLYLMKAVRWILMFARRKHLIVHLNRVETEDNILADHLSRLRIEEFRMAACNWDGFDVDWHLQPSPEIARYPNNACLISLFLFHKGAMVRGLGSEWTQ
eukprot:827031_1